MGFEAFATKPAAPPRSHKPEPQAEESVPAEPQGVTTVTPSGIEIEYQWAPRRLYRLNGDEVPSVTTVLGVLDKSGALSWWAQRMAVEGCIELAQRGKILLDGLKMKHPHGQRPDAQTIVDLLVAEKLSINHVKDKAADRGVNVHGALEKWVENDYIVYEEEFAEHERGYISGLREFLAQIHNETEGKEAELMVGSLEHQYAGRFDLVLTLAKPVEVVTRVFPKKPPRIEEIPAGRYLLDLKTSKRVYDTHYLQLEAYEAAAVECGYAPTDYRGVVHVTEDGRYELALNKDWCFEDFLAVRKVYQVMNEREVLRILREDLDAQEVA